MTGLCAVMMFVSVLLFICLLRMQHTRGVLEANMEKEVRKRTAAARSELERMQHNIPVEVAEYKRDIQEEMRSRQDSINRYWEKARQRDADAKEARDKARNKLQEVKDRLNNLGRLEQVLAEREAAFANLVNEKTVGFPWLASAYADYLVLEEDLAACKLRNKTRPAIKAADAVREAAHRRKQAEAAARVMQYQLNYYESLFPWLVDLKDENIDDRLIMIRQDSVGDNDNANDDAAKKWLAPEEYAKLSNCEKYQLALDRYWGRKKSNWEIGCDYERYVGWLYESQGMAVTYKGIIDGFDDLGRDLIAVNDRRVSIVQCKYWSANKTIHEKHVFQLYGTMIAYSIDHPNHNVTGHFVTSTTLSDRAKEFAARLGIEVKEQLPLAPYPCIKCNISRKDGERIYHLPFDQQYDTTKIEPERGECFALTIKEAEDKGFRRAFRYTGLSRAA